MKRFIIMLTLAAMLVVALTVTAAPSFADPDCAPPTKPNCKANGGKFTGNGGSGGTKPPGQTNNPNPGK